jgi:hypothetical protein
MAGEINTLAGEAMLEVAAVRPDALALKDAYDKKNAIDVTTSIASVKDLTEADARGRAHTLVEKNTTGIEQKLVDLVRLCDPAFTGPDRDDLIKNFAGDLGTVQLFQALQAKEPGIFGDPAHVDVTKGYIEGIFKNPVFTKIIKEKVSGLLSGEKINYDELAKIQDEIVTLGTDKTKKEADLATTTTRINDLGGELIKYDSLPNPSNPDAGLHLKELRNLTLENSDLSSQLGDLELTWEKIKTFDIGTKKGAFPPSLDLGGPIVTFATRKDFDNWLVGSSKERTDFSQKMKDLKRKIGENNFTINELKENEIKYKKELEDKKKAEASLALELKELDKKIDEKTKDKDGKDVEIKDKEKTLTEAIDKTLRDAYTDLYLGLHTVAGEWKGEKIKTIGQLTEKRIFEAQKESLIKEKRNGTKSINGKETDRHLDVLKKAKAGEGIADYGKSRIEALYNDGTTSNEMKEHLKTIVEFDPVENKVSKVLNAEKFKELSTRLTSEFLAIQVAKDPYKLINIFSRDDALARTIMGDEVPKMMEQAIKDNKYDKDSNSLSNVSKDEGIIKRYRQGFQEWWKNTSPEKIMLMLAALVALGLIGAKISR